MSTQAQPHSNVKLSAAQVKMLKWCEHGIQFSVRTEKADSNRATRLASMGLVSCTSTKFGFNDYLITDAGRAFLAALTPVVPTIEAEAPAINEVAPEGERMDEDTYPYSEGESPVSETLGDELPAYQAAPARPQNTLTYFYNSDGPPEMDDSDDIDCSEEDMFALCAAAPKTNGGPKTTPKFLDDDKNFSIGDSVTFRFNTYSPIKEYFSGTIVDLKTSVVLNSVMYCVQPDADDRLAYFAPVWIMPYQIEGQAHLDHAYDQLPALRKIEAAYVAWETAFLAGRYEEAGRLDMIHRKLEDEHHERTYGPRRPSGKIAPQSTQEGTTADIRAIEAYSSTMRDPASAIANTPASRALSIRPNESHPLRVIQVGSAASKTDWEAFQVARAAQHAEAKARVDANKRMMGGGL